MRWGLSHAESVTQLEVRMLRDNIWRRWFAWYPVQLTNGQYVWFEYVMTRYYRQYLFSTGCRQYRAEHA